MNRYLVIQLARFGDLVQSKRLLLSLLSRQDAEVHLCLERSLAELAALLFPEVILHPIAARGGCDGREVFRANREALESLRALDFCEIYNLNYSGLNLALSTLFEGKNIRGHRLVAGQPLMDQWTALAFRWTGQRRSSPINLMDLWAWLAAEPIAPDAVNKAAVPGLGAYGVVLAGRQSRRSLPPSVLAAVVTALCGNDAGRPIVLLGEKSEQPLAVDFINCCSSRMRARIDDRTGQTDWRSLIELITPMSLLITPDTGTMHLAAHLGVPTAAFFLSSAWVFETGPYGLGHSVWQATAACLPCLESRPCPNHLLCLEPFSDRLTLRALAGRFDGEQPEGVMLMQSALDPLGVTYKRIWGGGLRPEQERARESLRALLMEYNGLGTAEIRAETAFMADKLYREPDWML